jgi:hypothetical protein
MDQDRGTNAGVETGPLRHGAGNRGTKKAIGSTTATAITKARKKNRRSLVLYDSFDCQGGSIEVEEEPNVESSCSEIGLELHEVNVSQAFNSL